MKEYLIDTSVFIDYLRGKPKATAFLDSLPLITTSSLTVGELYQGARDQRELLIIKKFIQERISVLHISTQISAECLTLLEKYSKQYNLLIVDALIAATAIENDLTLVSANKKHFQMIKNLSFEVFIS